MNLSVVIPAYNERDNIIGTVEELLSVVGKIPDIDTVQIIVVDDHSSDNTFDVVSRMYDPRIACLRFSRRSGSHTALRAGIRETNGDAVLCISADGQDDPRCLEEMLARWRNGDNIIWALRHDRNKESALIRLPAQIFYKTLFWLAGSGQRQVDLSRADFYLLDRTVVDAINSCRERNTSLFGLIAWLGFKQGFVYYDRRQRVSGSSKWNFRSRILLAKDWIVAFSGVPLRIASSVGILTAVSGICYAIFVVVNKLFFGNPVPGWTSLIVLVLILSGVQLTILGIIGEYLWRNLDEARSRPLFFIEKRTGHKDDSVPFVMESGVAKKERSLS